MFMWFFFLTGVLECNRNGFARGEKEKQTMKTTHLLVPLVLFAALLAACSAPAKVGTLQTESQSVDLGGAKSVNVNIKMGAGSLDVAGGAEKLLQADFTYNV